MLKLGGETVRRVVLDMYSAILKPGAPTPTPWKHTAMKVRFKSGPYAAIQVQAYFNNNHTL
eukprot:9052195-Pyramimonas_sp.AAC.2